MKKSDIKNKIADLNKVINQKKHFTIAQIIIFTLIVASASIAATTFIITICNKSDRNLSTLTSKDSNMEDFEEVYNIINNDYYKKVNKQTLIEGAINGMLLSLKDPHTLYMTKSETDNFNSVMNGSYEGIGAEIALNSDNNVIVYSVFKNSPAFEAGLKFNDVIIKVNGKSTDGMSTTDVVKLIKDQEHPVANIIVLRDGIQKEFNVKKRIVEIETVESKVYDRNSKKIGYVLINSFANNTYLQFKNQIEDLEKQNISGLIIDVRDNTGGYLDCVSNMLDMMIPEGKVMYQIADKKNTKIYKSKNYESRNYPIVVLTNESSASASEILAIGLKESYGASLVGKTTYGKGTVQITKNLSNGGMIKYTIQKWLSPEGNWINEKGVKPDYEIDLPEDFYSTKEETNDLQLQKAIETLENKILKK